MLTTKGVKMLQLNRFKDTKIYKSRVKNILYIVVKEIKKANKNV